MRSAEYKEQSSPESSGLSQLTAQVDSIYLRREKLQKAPIAALSERSLLESCQSYLARTHKSKARFEKAKSLFPDGIQHHNSFVKPYPLFIQRASGSKVYDLDGNEYVDFTMGAGACLFGHHPLHLQKALEELNSSYASYPLFHHEAELELAEKIMEFMPSIEAIKFFQSGTEAVQAAIRLARVVKRKPKVIKVGGSYHGWIGCLIRDIRLPGVDDIYASGLDKNELGHCLSLRPNDIASLHRLIDKHQKDIAAFIVELPGPESGKIPLYPDFVKEVERLCKKRGLIFILDEVVSGFRLSQGGAQSLYEVEPDLTTLGKVVGGGSSLSAVGGRKELMDHFSRDFSKIIRRSSAYVGGTMTANAIATHLGLAMLQNLEEINPYEHMNNIASEMVKKLNGLFQAMGSQFFAYNFGSIVQVETVSWPSEFSLRQIYDIFKRLSALEGHQLLLQAEGILCLSGTRFFVSYAHSERDLEALVEAYRKLIEFTGN